MSVGISFQENINTSNFWHRHFEMTVINHIETNFLRIVLPSFQNDSPFSRALKMTVSTNQYLAGC